MTSVVKVIAAKAKPNRTTIEKISLKWLKAMLVLLCVIGVLIGAFLMFAFATLIAMGISQSTGNTWWGLAIGAGFDFVVAITVVAALIAL